MVCQADVLSNCMQHCEDNKRLQHFLFVLPFNLLCSCLGFKRNTLYGVVPKHFLLLLARTVWNPLWKVLIALVTTFSRKSQQEDHS